MVVGAAVGPRLTNRSRAASPSSNPIMMPSRLLVSTALLVLAPGVLTGACTLDIGENFQVAEVVYDEGFFYCEVEPVLFQQGCGSGDPARGESAQGCHFNRQR